MYACQISSDEWLGSVQNSVLMSTSRASSALLTLRSSHVQFHRFPSRYRVLSLGNRLMAGSEVSLLLRRFSTWRRLRGFRARSWIVVMRLPFRSRRTSDSGSLERAQRAAGRSGYCEDLHQPTTVCNRISHHLDPTDWPNSCCYNHLDCPVLNSGLLFTIWSSFHYTLYIFFTCKWWMTCTLSPLFLSSFTTITKLATTKKNKTIK